MKSGFDASIPAWQGEDPWLFLQRHRLEPMDDMHWHSHIEINYLIDCSMIYTSAGHQIEVPERRIAVFWAAIPHQVTEVTGDGQIICVYVPVQEFMRWNMPIRFSHEVLHGGFLLNPSQNNNDLIAFERWWDDCQQQNADFRRQALDEIQMRLRRMALSGWQPGNSTETTVRSSSGIGTRDIVHVETMANFIAEHYHEFIGVNEVAEHVELHPNYAMTLFKRIIGLPISAYITRHRLSHAQAMLLNTDKKILAVAMDCGFGSLSRFYETFRSYLGTTPRQYRKQWTQR